KATMRTSPTVEWSSTKASSMATGSRFIALIRMATNAASTRERRNSRRDICRLQAVGRALLRKDDRRRLCYHQVTAPDVERMPFWRQPTACRLEPQFNRGSDCAHL